MRRLLNRLGYWLSHRGLEADLAEEIEFHRNMKQREFEEAGLPALAASTASEVQPPSCWQGSICHLLPHQGPTTREASLLLPEMILRQLADNRLGYRSGKKAS
jgi:hypothetical protein